MKRNYLLSFLKFKPKSRVDHNLVHIKVKVNELLNYWNQTKQI